MLSFSRFLGRNPEESTNGQKLAVRGSEDKNYFFYSSSTTNFTCVTKIWQKELPQLGKRIDYWFWKLYFGENRAPTRKDCNFWLRRVTAKSRTNWFSIEFSVFLATFQGLLEKNSKKVTNNLLIRGAVQPCILLRRILKQISTAARSSVKPRIDEQWGSCRF
jgi:hypothetical protein